MRVADPVWDDLVSAALVGTGRRQAADLPADGALGALAARVDRTDEAVRLLDLAAIVMVHRRAGRRAPAGAPPAPCTEVDPRPTVPEAARVRLRILLDGDGMDFLPEWLALARTAGLRAPESELPALLTAARSRTDLRETVADLAGPRGRWLAGLNPDWAWLTRIAAGAGDDPVALWRHGQFGERLAAFKALRGDDADAARGLLEQTWRAESAEDRAVFVAALRTGLAAADEGFLEAALDDRAKVVRIEAARLLTELPAAAYAARMRARARACLRPGEAGRVLVVPPTECDDAMRRDGIAETSPTGREDHSWWLGEIVAATPLAEWADVFGETPEEIVARTLPRRFAEDVRDGWARAAVQQRDVAWARALAGRGAPTRLLTVLPAAECAEHVARHIAAHGLSEALQLLTNCPTPWPATLGDAVLDAFATAAKGGGYPWSFSGARDVAGRGLDPTLVDRVEQLAEGDGEWPKAFRTLADTLRYRATMRGELLGR
ncbi:DUF5691 domain-containing protein [Embleya sp. NBC_00896]|uniref:DUF5691 domain-containing protein n=1 Tax=Embleya sp. NBC_00896 TaxID=2975961 RepID=UPI00386C673E|nr:DUF5691 domain-containing protein [Embleya sp. NBC_00896]